MDKVIIWLDGRVKNNPGFGGWAALLDYNGVRKLVSGNSNGERLTNNQCYIEAAIFALQQLKQPCTVEIISDSQYLVNVGNWTWEQKSNFDEWQRFETIADEHDVTLVWQKELTCEEQKIVRAKAEDEYRKAKVAP